VEYFTRNPYHFLGGVVHKNEIIPMISEALDLNMLDIYKNSNKAVIVDARLIIYYEFYRMGVPISKISEITKIPRKRSVMSSSISKYKDKIKYDPIFRRKVEKVDDYFKLKCIRKDYKLLWK
jgi:hypothetical protein